MKLKPCAHKVITNLANDQIMHLLLCMSLPPPNSHNVNEVRLLMH